MNILTAYRKSRKLVHLIDVGDVPGTPARELQPGQKIMWNYGHIYEVINVSPSKTGKSITIIERNIKTGEHFTRRLRAERLVAIVSR